MSVAAAELFLTSHLRLGGAPLSRGPWTAHYTLHITRDRVLLHITHYTWHHLLHIGTLHARCRGVPCIMSWDTKGALTNTAENLEFLLKEWYFVFWITMDEDRPCCCSHKCCTVFTISLPRVHCSRAQPSSPPAPSCPLLYSAAFNGRISLRHVWRIVDIISVPSCLKTFQVTGQCRTYLCSLDRIAAHSFIIICPNMPRMESVIGCQHMEN